MHVLVAYLFTVVVLSGILFAFGGDILDAYWDVRDSWVALEEHSERRVDTRIAGPADVSRQERPMLQVTFRNAGDVAVARFSDWDALVELPQNSTSSLAYLVYTTSTSPTANQWTVRGIYFSAASSTPEVVDPEILNPGEEMVVWANPRPAPDPNTYSRLTLSTPNSAIAKVIVLKPTTLYVVDEPDRMVYRYLGDGTLLGSHALDAQNGNAKGVSTDDVRLWVADSVDDQAYAHLADFATTTGWALDPANEDATGATTDGTNVWVVDGVDDKAYKYMLAGASVSSFSLTAANDDPAGITTDGTYLWVADQTDDRVYKYTLVGGHDSDFALTGGNADPTGLTTDGSSIWVVDGVDDRVYKYSMTGVRLADFALAAANADPQGVTVTPR